MAMLGALQCRHAGRERHRHGANYKTACPLLSRSSSSHREMTKLPHPVPPFLIRSNQRTTAPCKPSSCEVVTAYLGESKEGRSLGRYWSVIDSFFTDAKDSATMLA